jgi:phenylalanyl-tRNA synthetase beta chain
MKGAVELLLESLGIAKYDFSKCADISFMHPGRSAYALIGKKAVGYFGEAYPDIAEALSLPEHTLVGAFSLDEIFKSASIDGSYEPPPKYPPVPRDISLLTSAETAAGDMLRTIKRHGGPILEKAKIFDVYVGAQVPEGMKSVAFSLIFRSRERTLTDTEVAARLTSILAALKKEFGAHLRS